MTPQKSRHPDSPERKRRQCPQSLRRELNAFPLPVCDGSNGEFTGASEGTFRKEQEFSGK
jgi:hypothetical protein